MKQFIKLAAASALATSLVSLPATAEITKKEWQVVGTWANLENYKQHARRCACLSSEPSTRFTR